MAKTAAISVRVSERLKEALEKAASDDDRTIAAYVERLLRSHLAEKGYLREDT